MSLPEGDRAEILPGRVRAIRWTWADEERLVVMALFRVTVSMLVQRQLSQRMRMKGSGSGLVWEG
jgi:hypothetical protein